VPVSASVCLHLLPPKPLTLTGSSPIWLFPKLCYPPRIWPRLRWHTTSRYGPRPSRMDKIHRKGYPCRSFCLPRFERRQAFALGLWQMYVSPTIVSCPILTSPLPAVLSLKGAYSSGYAVLGASAIATVGLLFL